MARTKVDVEARLHGQGAETDAVNDVLSRIMPRIERALESAADAAAHNAVEARLVEIENAAREQAQAANQAAGQGWQTYGFYGDKTLDPKAANDKPLPFCTGPGWNPPVSAAYECRPPHRQVYPTNENACAASQRDDLRVMQIELDTLRAHLDGVAYVRHELNAVLGRLSGQPGICSTSPQQPEPAEPSVTSRFASLLVNLAELRTDLEQQVRALAKYI